MNDSPKNTSDYECVADPCATITSKVQSLTKQIPVTPVVIKSGPVFVKIPVVLAEINITIPVEATITLDQPAMEIKRIKKNVFLTQSRIIPFFQECAPDTGILFIEGFIRKNIEYATKTCSIIESPNVCGDIRCCTVEVPFNFTTRINFIRELQGCNACSDPVIGHNPCGQSFFSTEFFNEKPFTELVRADIAEVDIHINPTISCIVPAEQIFTGFTEKIVVNLTLKVLQEQQVKIAAL